MQNDIQYFNLEKYLKNINIESDVLEHLGELQESFDKYLKILMSYGHEQAVTYLTLELFNEMLYSNQIEENKVLPPADFISNDLLATSKYLTNRKICDIQKLLLKDVSMPYPIGEYRNVPVFIKRAGEIIYNAPTVEDLNLFMRDFIKIYNCNNDDLIHNDPFIKSALIHFLFIKIHPFVDGNGRVSRVLQNIKFTDLVNRTYANIFGDNFNLKISPLNISYSIYRNKQSYYDRLNAIEFKENALISESFNKWLNFLIYMYEEQLYYNLNSRKMMQINSTLQRIKK